MPDEAETGLSHAEHEGTAETASEREVNGKAGSNSHAWSPAAGVRLGGFLRLKNGRVGGR